MCVGFLYRAYLKNYLHQSVFKRTRPLLALRVAQILQPVSCMETACSFTIFLGCKSELSIVRYEVRHDTMQYRMIRYTALSCMFPARTKRRAANRLSLAENACQQRRPIPAAALPPPPPPPLITAPNVPGTWRAFSPRSARVS